MTTPLKLLHTLWTKAIGTKDYKKEEWTELERLLVPCKHEFRLHHATDRYEDRECIHCGHKVRIDYSL